MFFSATDFKTGEGAIYRGKPKTGKADCSLTISDEDLILLAQGKLNAQNVSNVPFLSELYIGKYLIIFF